jgi:hypothetical protein
VTDTPPESGHSPPPEHASPAVTLVAWVLTLALLFGVAAAAAWAIGGLTLPGLRSPGEAFREATAERERASIIEKPIVPATEPDCIVPVVSDSELRARQADLAEPVTGGEVRNPTWRVQPAASYPQGALDREVASGEVMLRCLSRADGAFQACVVEQETPPGLGFAEAALRGLCVARVSPRTVNGAPQASVISWRMRFRLE